LSSSLVGLDDPELERVGASVEGADVTTPISVGMVDSRIVGDKDSMVLSVTEEGLEVAGVLSTQYVAVTLILSTPALNSFKGFSLMTLKAKNNASSVKTSFGIVKAICSLRSVASPNPRSKPLERVSFVQVTPDSSSSPGPLTFGPRSIITESSPLPSTTRNSSSTVQSSIW